MVHGERIARRGTSPSGRWAADDAGRREEVRIWIDWLPGGIWGVGRGRPRRTREPGLVRDDDWSSAATRCGRARGRERGALSRSRRLAGARRGVAAAPFSEVGAAASAGALVPRPVARCPPRARATVPSDEPDPYDHQRGNPLGSLPALHRRRRGARRHSRAARDCRAFREALPRPRRASSRRPSSQTALAELEALDKPLAARLLLGTAADGQRQRRRRARPQRLGRDRARLRR